MSGDYPCDHPAGWGDRCPLCKGTGVVKCICGTPQDDGECFACSMRDCPHGEPLHYHHDGCPACIWDEMDLSDVTPPKNTDSQSVVQAGDGPVMDALMSMYGAAREYKKAGEVERACGIEEVARRFIRPMALAEEAAAKAARTTQHQSVRRTAYVVADNNFVSAPAFADPFTTLGAAAKERDEMEQAAPDRDYRVIAIEGARDTEHQSITEAAEAAAARIDKWPEWKRRAAADLRVTPRDDARDTECKSVAEREALCNRLMADDVGEGDLSPQARAEIESRIDEIDRDTECRSVSPAEARALVGLVGDIDDIDEHWTEEEVAAARKIHMIANTDCGSVDGKGQG